MVLQYLVLQLILLLCRPLNTSALMPSLAKPGCQAECGGLTIPYPFGIGNSSCYLDEWFEIDCHGTMPRPFLKRLNLEVLNISLPGYRSDKWIRVNNPIMSSSNCNGSRYNSSVVDLRNSTFIYSQTENRFTVAGCKNRAIMANTEPFIAGCTSGCYGVCCQTTIPSYVKVFNVTFESIEPEEGSSDQECKYAFLVENQWPIANSSSCFSSVQGLEYAPAVLLWGVYTLTEETTKLRDQSRLKNSTYICGVGDGDDPTLDCYCKDGFEGNPYVPNGCQDINECEAPWHNDCPEACINIDGGYKCDDGKHRIVIIVLVLGSGLGLLILVTVIWWSYKVVKTRQKIKLKKKFFKRNGGLLLQQQLSSSQSNVDKIKVFTSEELEMATDHFSKNRILGQGGQGTVYKGMLPDGRIVAVKKSKIEGEGKLIEQFINEVVILSQLDHRNVVKVLGCCLETEVPLLVYEFVSNGNLFQYLHEHNEVFSVSWTMRLQIATEVAGALSYLHSAASIPIYHRDIKSTNILLDDKFRAKVSDFGTSRTIAIDQTHLTTLVHGTFGYLDPEYFQSSQFTDKSDVYSFGVVLVELLTGQRPISSVRSEEDRGLVSYFLISMEENRLFNILDAQVAEKGEKDVIVAVANLSKKCLNNHGRNRPTMSEVVIELGRINKLRKACNGEGSYQEVGYASSQETEGWESFSISSRFGADHSSIAASVVDEQPLMIYKTW